MSPRVWERVVSGRYSFEPGAIQGFAARRIAGVSYPALVRELGGVVDGVVYHDVSDADVARLDHFEGDAYARIQVVVNVAGISFEAFTYLFVDEGRVTADEWKADQFDAERFLRDYRPGVG